MMSIRNMNIRMKLFISYILLCIPTLLVAGVIFQQSKLHIEESTSSFVELYANQICHTLDSHIDSINKLSKSIYYERDIFNYLLHEREYSIAERIYYNTSINRLLSYFILQKPELFGVTITSAEGDVYSMGYNEEVPDSTNLTQEDWYQEITKANGNLIIIPEHPLTYTSLADSSKITSIGRLLKSYLGKSGGVLLFDIESEVLVNSGVTAPLDYNTRVIITTSDHELIYDSSSHNAEPYMILIDNDDFINIHKVTDIYNLNVDIFVSKKELFRPIDKMLGVTFWVVVLSVLAITWFSFSFSNHIAKPILRLTESMHLVESAIYEPIPESNRKDEIGILTRAYNNMVTKIRILIEDVYLAKLNKKEAELSALQAQINPHMLYNTLESIRMRAAINDDMEVSNMVKLLGKMFRFALDHSQSINYISDEINYIETYIQLQNIRYENKFSIHIHMTDEIRNSRIINLVFQPIIENSIIHGFKNKKDDCQIYITGQVINQQIQISIKDNGCGIPCEKVHALNSRFAHDNLPSGSSIGLRNVASRLKLHYGDSHRIIIHSIEGKETTIIFYIPII